MFGKDSTPSFVLTLPIHYTHGQKNKLDTIFRVCCHIQNSLTSDRLKALKQIERTKEWRNNQAEMARLYKERDELSGKKIKNKKAIREDIKAKLKVCFEKREAILEANDFTSTGFQKCVKRFQYHYAALCHSAMAQKIAADVWNSFEDYLYGGGKEIHFKPWTEFDKIECKSNESGLRYSNGELKFGRKLKFRIPLDKKDAYEAEALTHRVKYCKIVRGWGKSGAFYQLQLVLEGVPPIKKDKDGNPKYQLGKGRVGTDIGTQTVALAAEKHVTLRELADEVQNIENELRRINRAMDRSRRANNPQFFNENGEIIRKDKLPKELLNRRGKRLWHDSNNYKRLAERRRYLYFKQATLRKLQHRTMANEFLSYGDEFYIETMQFKGLAKRAKETKKSSSGKNKSKKRFGKSIANKAPALFVKILSEKVVKNGGTFTKINTYKAKASQYNHLNHEYNKKKLSQRWNHMPDGKKIQRDLYSAFLIMNVNPDLESFNDDLCNKTYPNFCINHDKEIARLKGIKTPSSTGVKKTA